MRRRESRAIDDRIATMSTINKKRIRISSPASDTGEDKSSDSENGIKSNTCFVCDEKDNFVLVCHGDDCPLAIHQSCCSDEPDFDEIGNFYCPYCWYKRLVVKSINLQKKLKGIDKDREETSGGGEELEKLMEVNDDVAIDKCREEVETLMEVNVSPLSENRLEGCDDDVAYDDKCRECREETLMEVNASPPSENRLECDDDVANEANDHSRNCRETSGGGEEVETLMDVNLSPPSGNRLEGGGDDVEYEKFIAMEKNQRMNEVVEESPSHDEDDDDAGLNEEENGFMNADDDEEVERNYVLSSPLSDSFNNVNNELALVIHQPPIKAQPYCSVSPNKPSFQIKSYVEKKLSFAGKKHKRILWTQAEEEMLRVGVEKFPGTRKNIPWRRILEYGKDVFHEERAPSDLKDKWRKINKMPVDTGKWVSLPTENTTRRS